MIGDLFKEKVNKYDEETISILRLIRSQNIGTRTFHQLIGLFGSAEKALDNISDFSIKGGASKPIKVFSKSDALKEITKLNNNNAGLISFKNNKYSNLLLHTPDFPPILSYKGNIDLLNSEKMISIVGARNSSANARIFASNLASELSNADYTTVSGLARGIDTAVHNKSISRTIAVIAGGIDHIYPPENKNLYEQIISESLIISESPIGSKPLSKHFPQRNRIIAGLTPSTAIIEASFGSGSLITAQFALEYGRDVFAMPGFPLDPRCKGSNKLIKDGAYLLESSKDILNLKSPYKLYHPDEDKKDFKVPKDIKVTDKARDLIKSLLSSSPISYETLIYESNLSLRTIYVVCLELEIAGKLARHPGNKVSLIYTDS